MQYTCGYSAHLLYREMGNYGRISKIIAEVFMSMSSVSLYKDQHIPLAALLCLVQ